MPFAVARRLSRNGDGTSPRRRSNFASARSDFPNARRTDFVLPPADSSSARRMDAFALVRTAPSFPLSRPSATSSSACRRNSPRRQPAEGNVAAGTHAALGRVVLVVVDAPGTVVVVLIVDGIVLVVDGKGPANS